MTHLVNPVNPEILSKVSYEICEDGVSGGGIYGLIVLVPQFFLERKTPAAPCECFSLGAIAGHRAGTHSFD